MTGETIHASCVAIGGRGVLLAGRSGAGKSDLALRLIDRGARLVADDYTLVAARGGRLVARAPATIAGRLEIRGVGIVAVPAEDEAEIALHLDLDAQPERLPESSRTTIAGIGVASGGIAPFEASAPVKVEWLLKAVPV